MATDPSRDDRADRETLASSENVSGKHVLIACFEDGYRAEQALSGLMNLDFPLDRLSVIGRASASGDDPLGLYYSNVGERIRGWGGLGAFWGGIWGFLSGAAGLFLLPGIGPVVAAGPIVEAIAGAAVGAGVGGTLMAGAGAATQLTTAIHRIGIPESCLQEIHQRLERNEHILMLILEQNELDRWKAAFKDAGPVVLWDLPYMGLVEGVRCMF